MWVNLFCAVVDKFKYSLNIIKSTARLLVSLPPQLHLQPSPLVLLPHLLSRHFPLHLPPLLPLPLPLLCRLSWHLLPLSSSYLLPPVSSYLLRLVHPSFSSPPPWS